MAEQSRSRPARQIDAYQRAAQIWAVLTLCASNRQVSSYPQLGKLTGLPRQSLGNFLEPIQSYCIKMKLPPLTSLVVSERTGLPGEGFIGADDVPKAQARVFSFAWLTRKVPTVDELRKAAEQLPSKGKTLKELERRAARLNDDEED